MFSYLAAVTITDGRASHLDLCLALMAFSSESSSTCLICCDLSFMVIFEIPVISTFKCRAFGEEATTTYYNFLGLKQPALTGFELRMFSMNATTKLQQLVIRKLKEYTYIYILFSPQGFRLLKYT
jgi:hypothetical protein